MSSESQWPGAASDTGNVLTGTALGALLGGSGAAAGFSVDYERAPQTIADLEYAAKFFSDPNGQRARLGETTATAGDTHLPYEDGHGRHRLDLIAAESRVFQEFGVVW